ncbi:hypothetical protein BDZ45DRAFT_677247 [Acephala macrosclerotiorum]|nr:hypothetical protein BDZ45DRAFT_677247 [Acephala macrosclerotiorum]
MKFTLLGLLVAGLYIATGADACACEVGSAQGQYCGYCAQVTSCLSGSCFTDVFECNPAGGCYDYGYRTSCATDEYDPAQCPI